MKLQETPIYFYRRNYCCLSIFFLLFYFNSTGQTSPQTKENYLVKYNVELPYSLQLQNKDSVIIKVNGKVVTGNINIPDSIQLSINGYLNPKKEAFQKSFTNGKISLYYDVKGNADSSIINMGDKTLPQNVNIKTPDLFYYKMGKWTVNKNGVITDVPYHDVVYKKQQSEKTILGYQCASFLIVDNALQNSVGEMWVANDLPNTLMPFAGYHLQSGAVLEFYSYQSGFRATATEIIKM